MNKTEITCEECHDATYGKKCKRCGDKTIRDDKRKHGSECSCFTCKNVTKIN